jgi:hypothetical protein
MPPPNDPRDPLDFLFERWRDAAPEPSDNLESAVWRRIAADENPSGLRRGWFATIEAIFARPSFTAAFVVGCVLLGLLLAETRVSQMQAKRSVQFVQSYLRQIDPQLDGVEGSASAESVSIQP